MVVVFAEKKAMRNLLRAAYRRNLSSKFVWIGSDAWSSRESVAEDNSNILEGALTVQPLVRQLEGFDDYFTTLTPETNSRNPWFKEYWETVFNCSLNTTVTLGQVACDPDYRISIDGSYKHQRYLHFVRDAVHAFAHALNNMHMIKCGGQEGICKEMMHFEGEELKSYLENVTFKGM